MIGEETREEHISALIFQPASKPAVNDLPLVANRTEIEKAGPFFL
jgi:hypothetical protein